MKRALLDYDNTICNFSKGMFEKWNSLPEFNKYCRVELSDITEYRLHNCLSNLGLSVDKALELLDKFWHIENFYQDYYYDMNCRNSILNILKALKNKGYLIELNTLCPSKELIHSKMRRVSNDIELLNNIDNIHVTLFDGRTMSNKSFNYDIIIEDNPIYIEEYLKNNLDGRVYMPLWKYNEDLTSNLRVFAL